MKKYTVIPAFILVLGFTDTDLWAQHKKEKTPVRTLAMNQSAPVSVSMPEKSDKKDDAVNTMTDEQALEMITQQLETATVAQPAVEAPLVDENRIYTVVERPAQFPGGAVAIQQFLTANLHYPKDAKKDNVIGKVYTKVLIEKNGSISDIQVVKGLGHGCDEEAIRVIKSMTGWRPAHHQDNVVRSYYMLQVHFTPSN